MKRLINLPVIFDGRSLYNRHTMKRDGFEYFGIGLNAAG